jgi:hypothetical protein
MVEITKLPAMLNIIPTLLFILQLFKFTKPLLLLKTEVPNRSLNVNNAIFAGTR